MGSSRGSGPAGAWTSLKKISAEDPLSLPFQAAQVPVEHLTPLCWEGMIYLAAGLSLLGSFLIDLWKQRLRGGSSKDEVIGFALRPKILAKPDGFNKTKLASLPFAQTGWALLPQHQARSWTEDSSPCAACHGDKELLGGDKRGTFPKLSAIVCQALITPGI